MSVPIGVQLYQGRHAIADLAHDIRQRMDRLLSAHPSLAGRPILISLRSTFDMLLSQPETALSLDVKRAVTFAPRLQVGFCIRPCCRRNPGARPGMSRLLEEARSTPAFSRGLVSASPLQPCVGACCSATCAGRQACDAQPTTTACDRSPVHAIKFHVHPPPVSFFLGSFLISCFVHFHIFL